MILRTGLGIALVLFAVGSVAYLSTGGGEAANRAALPPTGGVPGTALTVYFFDMDVRCDTCIKLEGYAHEAVMTRFAEDYAAGRIGWVKLDLDAPEHAHFAEEFGLYTKSVVLVEHDASGTPVRWENLKRVWDLVEDKNAYFDYIESSIRVFRGEEL